MPGTGRSGRQSNREMTGVVGAVGGDGSWCLRGIVSIGDDEKTLEVDRGEGVEHCKCTVNNLHT